jgi:hypothetical protein
MNDVTTTTPKTSIAWPAWVINEMSSAIYKSKHAVASPSDWAKLNDNERALYTGYTHAALQWIVDQGWVRLPKAGE